MFIFIWLYSKERIKPEKPLLSLVMIVKDEADSIASTIESVRDHVDRYTILDTGSTDGTPSIIYQAFGKTPGQIYYEPFVDFATTRNRAIELEGRQSEFAIMLSGDETLHEGTQLRAYLQKQRGQDTGAFNVNIRYNITLEHDSVRIHRTSDDWAYVGVTHEYMTHASGKQANERIENVFIRHNVTGDRTKQWRKDAKLLLEAWAKRPEPRTAFYLAQTYECLSEWESAFMWYKRRWRMRGWREEEYEARFRMGRVAESLNMDWDSIEKIYRSASEYTPKRIEPLFAIAHHYYRVQNYRKSFDVLMNASKIPFPSNLTLFTRKQLYDYDVYDLLGSVAIFVNETAAGKNAVLKALAFKPGDTRLLEHLKQYNEL